MRKMNLSFVLIAMGLALAAPAAAIQEVAESSGTPVEIKIWLDEPNGKVLRPGERLDIHFQVTEDCYAVVYDVDTEGFIHILFPRIGERSWIEGRRIHRIPGPYDDYDLIVDGPKGIEYVVAVASPYPLDLRSLYDEEEGYDETVLFTGRITGDPSTAIHEINQNLTWGAEDYSPEGYASDIAWFYVGRKVPYPRYMVYAWYPDRYWDPWWDPYAHTSIWIDFSWNHNWCRPWWWCYGCVPVHHYWYVDYHSGQRVRWKSSYHVHHHDDWIKPYAHRVKQSRWTKEGRASRYSSKASEPVRVKSPRTVWKDSWRRDKDVEIRGKSERPAVKDSRRYAPKPRSDKAKRDAPKVRKEKNKVEDSRRGRSDTDKKRDSVKKEKKKDVEKKSTPKKSSDTKKSDGKKKSDDKPRSGKKR